MNAPVKFELIASTTQPRDFVIQPPQTLDRITFNTPDDGVLTGHVATLRRHLGSGEPFVWVELDSELTGQFRGVPLTAIISCSRNICIRLSQDSPRNWSESYLCDFSHLTRRKET